MADTSSLDSVPASFASLQSAFLPEKAQGVDKTIQFNLTGREPGIWSMTVRNGTLSYGEGAAEQPNVRVNADSDDWLKVLRGELNAVSAVMGGKIKLQGDMMLMMQFQNWFERPA